MDEVFESWALKTPQEREEMLRVQDPEVVHLIDFNMRMLWAAEIQARQFGLKGPVHPLDQGQLPLLSTMQFDGNVERGEKVYKLVKWPREVCEDPAIMLTAMRCMLPPSTGQRRRPRPLKPQRWHQLLQPPAKSWVDFERQLAQLVEQLLIQHVSLTQPSDTATPCGTGSQPENQDGDGGTEDEKDVEGDVSKCDECTSGGEGSIAKQEQAFSTARAAKRARQRERRKMGRALARAEAASCTGPTSAEDAHKPHTQAPDQSIGGAACLAESASQVTWDSDARPGETGLGTEEVTATDPQEEAASTNEGQHGDKEVPVHVVPTEAIDVSSMRSSSIAGVSPTTPARVNTDVGLLEDDMEEGPQGDGEAPSLTGLWTTDTRGVGRGKPMGGLHEDPWHIRFNRGRGGGRGRELAPPPGLQGLQGHRSQKVPFSLSQPWMPTPIPEEEDPDLPDLALGTWLPPDLDLLGSGLTRGDSTPSEWSSASYVQTPAVHWSKTPSPPSSPLLTPGNSRSMLKALGGCSEAFGSTMLGVPPTGAIPTYVTVPLAAAHSCPHCGGLFALQPDVAIHDTSTTSRISGTPRTVKAGGR